MPYSTEVLNRAATTAAAAQRQINIIRDNENLSAAGKRAAMAEVVIATRDQLKVLRESDKANRGSSAGDLYRQVFGQPVDPIEAMSYRDALGRANQLSNEDLRIEMQRAIARGDSLQMRACASVGWERYERDPLNSQGAEVVNAYGETDPAIERKLLELRDAQLNAGADMVQGMHFLFPNPPELEGSSFGTLEQLASGN